MPDTFRHEDVPDASTRVLIARGDLAAEGAHQIRRRVAGALAAGKGRVVVDLSDVAFLDSTALAALLDAAADAARQGAELRVVAPLLSRSRLILEMTGVDRLLRVAETRSAALGGV